MKTPRGRDELGRAPRALRSGVPVLGVHVDALTRSQMLAEAAHLVDSGGKHTVAYANVHVLNQAANNPALKNFLNAASLCFCDGNGVVLGARLLGGALPERMTGADWIWDFAALAEGRWRVFWLGGEPGVCAKAADRLREKHARLEIETDHGFHTDMPAVLAKINTFKPDVLLVGMGTPVQEAWVAKWRDQIDAPVVWVLGATHDFVAGKVARGPEWLHRDHEWLARLVADPRRLWKRYLVGNVAFAARILRQRLTQ